MFFSRTITETLPLKKPKNPETLPWNLVCQWNFLIMMTYYISLKRSWKGLFKGNVFGNVDWNYYHPKPETWYMLNQKFLKIITYYISLKRSWKKLFTDNFFENNNLWNKWLIIHLRHAKWIDYWLSKIHLRHDGWKGFSILLQKNSTYSGFWEIVLKIWRCIIGIRCFR